MNFKFRHKNYTLERDNRQFILTEMLTSKNGELYPGDSFYYADAFYLVKKLVSIHCLTSENGKEILQEIKSCCKELGSLLNTSFKQSYAAQVERSEEE